MQYRVASRPLHAGPVVLAPPAHKPCKHGHIAKRNSENKCLECLRIRSKARYASDLEKYREKARVKQRRRAVQMRDYERKHYAANLQKYMFKSAVSRAKFLGFVCTIALDDVVIPKFCPLLGLELKKGAGKAHAASPSLDRIRPHLGYVPGNVWVISQRANELKRDATVQELQKLATNLAEHVHTYPWEQT